MFENLSAKKNFSIDRLVTLCHVAEAGSIRAATGDNSIKQSQYSRQISELSSFLGVKLLDDSTKPHRVTEQGLELSHIARDLLTALDDFVGSCQGQPSKLVLGAGESQIQWLLIPSVLPKLKRAFPETNVIFRNLQTNSIIEALLNGEIDIGFVRKSALPGTLNSVGSFQIPYRLFIPKKFRAAFRTPVSLDQIAVHPMAVLEGAGQVRTTLDALAKDAGVKLRIVTECSSLTQLALLVSRKECCAILPQISRSQLDDSIDDYLVKGFESQERLSFAWNPRRTKIKPIVEKAARICSEA